MTNRTVWLPASLLLDHRLTNSAKLLWLLRQLYTTECQPPTPTLLQQRSGFARETVRSGLAQLAEACWLGAEPSGKEPRLSRDLLLDRQAGILAKLLYAYLLLQGERGTFSHSDLSQALVLDPKRLRPAIRELESLGWIELTKEAKFRPIHYSLLNPIAARRAWEHEMLLIQLNEELYWDEALMKRWLDLLIDSDEFEENARPGFLINPLTDERLEFDRYYPPKVAFEYNGAQHYRTTKRQPNPKKLWMQRARDYIKAGICAERGITLVIIHREDLNLERMREKVGNLLPLRPLEGKEELIEFLESLGRSKQGKAVNPK